MSHVQSLRAKSPLHFSIAKSVLKQNIYTYTSLSKVEVEAGDEQLLNQVWNMARCTIFDLVICNITSNNIMWDFVNRPRAFDFK